MFVPVVGDANGWYIWCGQDFRDTAEFFAPLHVSHVYEEYPENRKISWIASGVSIPVRSWLRGRLV
jgi:hypothetical protein